MSLEILRKLAGNEEEFEKGLVELGWFEFRPRLTPTPFLGKAKTSLNPCFKTAGQVKNTGAWVYRLELQTSKWRDAAAVVESQLKQEPQFAVVFCPLPDSLIILIPENPEKAFKKEKGGLTVDKIYLDIRRPSNYEEEIIKKLQAAPGEQFRSQLQKLPDTEKVTKRFYEKFKDNLEEFKKLITGISDLSDQTWYSSLMMNRLMFVYFLQRKGFLDGNSDYLADRLQKVKELRGRNEFQSFYRCFLRRLFHEGLGNKKREQDFEPLFGKIPYLNGGLFEVHEIEDKYQDEDGQTLIDIPDEAFEKIFKFFGEFVWCLDTRPSRTDREINPDVLGYIFEKYINQKQMGAYYTKEDITEYIAKNTIIPCIFDRIKQKRKEAVAESGEIWRLLQADPGRYIYEAVQKGVELDLPAEIAAGFEDVTKRGNWNTPVPEEYALPTEIWREVVARRNRYREIREKLVRGEVRAIDDLITYNLDICRFAQDVIEHTDDPELVRVVWESMAGYTQQVGSNKKEIPPLTILDPTCGSGAFLFAALNILEPLYESCLERMEQFVAEADQSGDTRKYPDFRQVLSRMNDREKHPNREYFILKSIILNNLYGVDIMPEAVEICKLRLFLKMAAAVEPDDAKPNYGLEPLPDIDFNIRAGNTLVGFVSADEVRGVTADGKPKQMTMFVESGPGEQMELIANTEESAVFKKIVEKLELADRQYELFRRQQTLGGEVTAEDKKALRQQLGSLGDELNRYLAKQYNIDPDREQEKYQQWLASHQPFHWITEFYGIMKRGGFDVIIGNPPYVETKKVKDYKTYGYSTENCKDLYALTLERSSYLSINNGHLGFIVPMSAFSVDRFSSLQELYFSKMSFLFISNWSGDAHPARLFEGVDKRLEIILARKNILEKKALYTSKYQKWYTIERPFLFYINPVYKKIQSIQQDFIFPNSIPKINTNIEVEILKKIMKFDKLGSKIVNNGNYNIYYTRKVSFFLQFLDFIPVVYDENHNLREPSELKCLSFNEEDIFILCLACLSSSLFYWYNIVNSDCRNLNKREILSFPIPKNNHNTIADLRKIIETLMESYKINSTFRTVNYINVGNVTVQYFNFRPSKPIIDSIDFILAKHYGFTDEELDFIINYDIKYRMGINGAEDEEDGE